MQNDFNNQNPWEQPQQPQGQFAPQNNMAGANSATQNPPQRRNLKKFILSCMGLFFNFIGAILVLTGIAIFIPALFQNDYYATVVIVTTVTVIMSIAIVVLIASLVMGSISLSIKEVISAKGARVFTKIAKIMSMIDVPLTAVTLFLSIIFIAISWIGFFI